MPSFEQRSRLRPYAQPFEDTAGILLDQVEYAMRADEIHLEHQAIQRWIELHKSQGRTSEKMPELEERLKELAAEIKNMEDVGIWIFSSLLSDPRAYRFRHRMNN